jgi:hypothetical protein
MADAALATNAGSSHALHAVGHRVVHGGRQIDRPVLVTDDVMRALEGLSRPSWASRSQTAARIGAACSPMLAVSTKTIDPAERTRDRTCLARQAKHKELDRLARMQLGQARARRGDRRNRREILRLGAGQSRGSAREPDRRGGGIR